MFCRNCGNVVEEKAVACPTCGLRPHEGKAFCHNCRADTDPRAVICVRCGLPLPGSSLIPAGGVGVVPADARSKLGAGLLGIFLGWLGIHRFYLGYTGIGVAQLVLGLMGLVTCGITSFISWIWGLVEGIMILAGSIDRDASGNALRP